MSWAYKLNVLYFLKKDASNGKGYKLLELNWRPSPAKKREPDFGALRLKQVYM